MSEIVETIDYKSYQINIHQDIDPIDPVREFDQLGTMICFHRRYNLGHKHNYDSPKEMLFDLVKEADPYVVDKLDHWESGKGWASIAKLDDAVKISNNKQKAIIEKTIEKYYIILPLYLYDHSGITISTGPFSCPWDSGQVGYIFISKEKAKKEYSWKNMSKSRIEKVIGYLKNEVETYDQFLTGDVYGYIISNEEDDHIDSCWGFFGHNWKENGLLEMAENAIDCELKREFDVLEFEKNCFAL
jgi:hypothetical protein